VLHPEGLQKYKNSIYREHLPGSFVSSARQYNPDGHSGESLERSDSASGEATEQLLPQTAALTGPLPAPVGLLLTVFFCNGLLLIGPPTLRTGVL